MTSNVLCEPELDLLDPPAALAVPDISTRSAATERPAAPCRERAVLGSPPRAPVPRPVRGLVILGLTSDGRRFRPSDWAERLAGATAVFRPVDQGADPRLRFSPYVEPGHLDGVSCVRVDARLSDIEPMAFDFVRRFALDNNLRVIDQDAR